MDKHENKMKGLTAKMERSKINSQYFIQNPFLNQEIEIFLY